MCNEPATICCARIGHEKPHMLVVFFFSQRWVCLKLDLNAKLCRHFNTCILKHLKKMCMTRNT
jgi:hypothetical protein